MSGATLEKAEVPYAPKVLVVGGKMYSRCADCEDIICMNKFLFGSVHLCLTPEEIAAKRNRWHRP